MGERVGQIAKVPEVKQSNSNFRVRRTERLQLMNSPVDRILYLQRTAGNQAVSRLMKSGALQAKLRIGQPGDVYEQEADWVADAVMRMPEPGVQRQVDSEEKEEEPLQAKFASGLTGTLQAKTEAFQNKTGMPDHLKSGLENLSGMELSSVRVHHNSSKPAQLNALAYTQGQDIHVGPGQEKYLPHEAWHVVQQMQGRVRPTMQAKGVSINDDAGLEREADVMGAKATHMKRAEQATRKPVRSEMVLQRYDASEHVKFGEVETLIGQAMIKDIVYPTPTTYIVSEGAMPASIAHRFNLSVDFLIARNASLYRTWTTKTGKKIRGFSAGDTIFLPGKTLKAVADKHSVTEKAVADNNADKLKTWTVPGTKKTIHGFDRGAELLIPSTELAVKTVTAVAGAKPGGKTKTITIKGVKFTYGEVIALGDLYSTPDDMYKAKSTELKELAKLIRKETSGKKVTTKEWNNATGGRYIKLAEKNVAHFAPPDPALVAKTVSMAGVNQKTEWEKYHRKALKEAQSGNKNAALGINAFADHFLTDAFSAGHLINKKDVMAKFEKAMAREKVREKFFDEVANEAWKDSRVSKAFKPYQSTAWHGRNIVKASHLSTILKGVYGEPIGKTLVLGGVAKIVHDDLNKSGVEVDNIGSDGPWKLSGDGKLNPKSLEVGRKAVAQSQVNILNTVRKTVKLDEAKLFKAVWDYVPRPTATGSKLIHNVIKILTDPSKSSTINEAAKIIKSKVTVIIDELVNRKELELR